MNENTKVTVLLPVYNGENYLKESINSVLKQTYNDFKLLIINDNSTDNSINIIKSFKDHRIDIINNSRNKGLIKVLNNGIDLIDSKYIVRMDHDDICMPNRLNTLVKYMDNYKDVGVCGSWVKSFGIKNEIIKVPIEDKKINSMMFFGSPIVHPSVIMRNIFIKKYNLKYDEQHITAEDYGFWVKSLRYFRITNIPEVLLKYRIHSDSITGRIYTDKEKLNNRIKSIKLILKELFNFWGFKYSKDMLLLHVFLNYPLLCKDLFTKEFLNRLEEYMIYLLDFVKTKPNLDFNYFKSKLKEGWFNVCYSSTKLGIWVYRKYFSSLLFESLNNNADIVKFLLKAIIKK